VCIFKIPKITFNLAYNISIFKSLGKGLERFIDKSKTQKVAFGMRYITEF